MTAVVLPVVAGSSETHPGGASLACFASAEAVHRMARREWFPTCTDKNEVESCTTPGGKNPFQHFQNTTKRNQGGRGGFSKEVLNRMGHQAQDHTIFNRAPTLLPLPAPNRAPRSGLRSAVNTEVSSNRQPPQTGSFRLASL